MASRSMKQTRGSRSIADEVDRNGNRIGPRRVRGEADPATRRRMIDEALKPGPAVKPPPAKPAPARDSDASGAGGRARRDKIDEIVDKAQR